MTLTRRAMMAGAAALALGSLGTVPLAGSVAAAETYSAADLLVPGPLPEKVLGNASAPVTIIEYSSLTCSHCAHFHTEVLPKLKAAYIDTGKVRMIFRDFPFERVAATATMLARCADEDGRYFAMVDALFATQKTWAFTEDRMRALLLIAKQAGFTQERFDACFKNQKLLNGIEAVRDRGKDKFGIDATPTFFINGQKHVGVLELEDLAKIIDPLVQ